MKTIIVGGGRGCTAVLKMVVQKRLAELSPQIVGVVDPNPEAPGMRFAREQGWETFASFAEALGGNEVDLVIEVTGIDRVRDEVMRLAAGRARVMDHQMARVFWDLDEIGENLRKELEKKTELEATLLEDRRRLQELLDSLPDSVMVLDKDRRIDRVNRRFEEVTGLSSEQVRGSRCVELCQGPDCESRCARCAVAKVLESGASVTVIEHNCCIFGREKRKERYYQIAANPIRNALGELNVVMTSREVTDQILLARETEELARRAEQILNTVRSIITISDLTGRFQFMNPRAETFFNIRAAQAQGKTVEDLFPPDVARLIKAHDEEVLREGKHLSHEETVVLNGEEHILLTERVLLYDYKDAPIAVCRVTRDVTASRRIHQELLESEKHAAVGKLAAGVAHELNNPLTGILTFSEILLDEFPEESPIREDIQTIMREALRCRQIVRDLLDFSRQGATNRKVIPLEPIVRRAIKLVEKQAAFHNIRFEVNLSEAPENILADSNQLQQVLLNLIINARDAMDGKGKIAIAARENKAESTVGISVTDTGCGISPDNMKKIFDPFFSTKGDRGNGLGLAAVRGIVEEHGGRITTESALGLGSTFNVFLPITGRGTAAGDGLPHSVVPAYHDWSEE